MKFSTDVQFTKIIFIVIVCVVNAHDVPRNLAEKLQFLQNKTTSVEFYIVLPRNLIAIWPCKGPNYQAKLSNSLLERKGAVYSYENLCYSIFENISGGIQQDVKVFKENNLVHHLSFSIPWQLSFVVMTSSLMVEWDYKASPIDTICINNYLEYCFLKKENYIYIDGLEANKYFTAIINPTGLKLLFKTESEEKKYTLQWTCPPSYCPHGTTCSILSGSMINSENNNYFYKCYHRHLNYSNCYNRLSVSDSAEPTIYEVGGPFSVISGYNPITIQLAEFRASEDDRIIKSFLPSAFPFLSYWCNGFKKCPISFPHMMSYLSDNYGFKNSDYRQYRLKYIYNEKQSQFCSDPNSVFMKDQNTCYKYLGEYTFKEGRRLCLSVGGDLPYNTEDFRLCTFFHKTLLVPGNWWALGSSKSARPQRLLMEQPEEAMVNEHGILKTCSEVPCPRKLSIICSLPPGGKNEFWEKYKKGDNKITCSSIGCKLNCPDSCSDVRKSIGIASTFMKKTDDFLPHVCRCYKKLNVQKFGLKEENKLGNYIFKAPENHCLHFSYAEFGNFSNAYCSSPSTLSLLRNKCEGQPWCSVKKSDMDMYLMSTCLPNVRKSLYVELEYFNKSNINYTCEKNGISYVWRCFYISKDVFSNPDHAKYYCNKNGWELVTSQNILPWELIPNNVDHVWAEEENEFSMYTINPLVISRSGYTMKFGLAQAVCIGPPLLNHHRNNSIVFKTTNTKNIRIDNTIYNITSNTKDTINSSKLISETGRIVVHKQKQENNVDSICIIPLFCPDISINGIKWPKQMPGTTLVRGCPAPYHGNATWICRLDGTRGSEYPNLSNCSYKLNYGVLKKMISNQSIPLHKTLNVIKNDLKNDTFATGDILTLTNLLNDARNRHDFDIQTKKEVTPSKNTSYATDIYSSINKILNKTEPWKGLQKKDLKMALNNVQSEVDDTAVNVTSFTLNPNSTKKYQGDALYVKVDKFSSSYFKKKAKRKYCHPNHKFAPTCIYLPDNITLYEDENMLVSITASAYTTLHCLFPGSPSCGANIEGKKYFGVLNSAVIGASVGHRRFYTTEKKPIVAKFRHIYSGDRYILQNKKCVWWNADKWDTSGCRMKRTGSNITICHCLHLTNLAVIMDINGILQHHKKLLNLTKYITIIGCSISMLCLCITIAWLSKKLKAPHNTNIIHINLCINLLISEIILLIGLDRTENYILCGCIAGALFYFLLATFTWSAVEAAHIYLLFVKIFPIRYSLLRAYYSLGYIFPALILFTALSITQGHGFGTEKYCWLDHRHKVIWYFVGPVLGIIITNFVVYGLAMWSLFKRKTSSVGDAVALESQKKLLKASITLAAVLCLTWGFGFLFIIEGTQIMAFIFTIINSLQGVALFLTLTGFGKKDMGIFTKLYEKKKHNSTKVLFRDSSKNKLEDRNNI